MILNTAPQDQAVLSNVGQIGEFRIRNSAKAFNILSSGLYANKIRAIIRELSCNAVDSHVAAGRSATPFDVHLPNQLEPWFAVRDYGTGLSHDQVNNIYTTYFESSKTDSNDYIGALGLGSKSPFSYTDNFTVTAVRDGRRGIYTAFINDQGIPSIALMAEEQSDEPSGVEVKFAVSDYYDYRKFADEARYVYTYFGLRPVISGVDGFEFHTLDYEARDIVQGVHQIKNSLHRNRSIAIMGNIAYPIEVPQAEQNLGSLARLLNCALELHFGIGELDFQASREGLSYIPQTIDSIKRKLTELNSVLADRLKTEADSMDNLWDRAMFLAQRKNNDLWSAAVKDYGVIATFDPTTYTGTVNQRVRLDTLESAYNIRVSGLQKEPGRTTFHTLKLETVYGETDANGNRDTYQEWRFPVNHSDHYVISDVKRGVKERVKHHYRAAKAQSTRNIFVLEPVNKDLPMKLAEFFTAINETPLAKRLTASSLTEKPRATAGNTGNASVLRLVESRRSRYSRAMVWNNAGSVADYDQTKNFYYVEMAGWTPVGIPTKDIKNFHEWITRADLGVDTIYGVRSKDIPNVRKQKNWIELGGFIRAKLAALDMNNVMGLVKESIDFKNKFKYTSAKLNHNSPYYKLYAEFKDIKSIDSDKQYWLKQLCKVYGIVIANVNTEDLIVQYENKVKVIWDRYPMLSQLSSYGVNVDVVVDYINMVDQTKGI